MIKVWPVFGRFNMLGGLMRVFLLVLALNLMPSSLSPLMGTPPAHAFFDLKFLDSLFKSFTAIPKTVFDCMSQQGQKSSNCELMGSRTPDEKGELSKAPGAGEGGMPFSLAGFFGGSSGSAGQPAARTMMTGAFY